MIEKLYKRVHKVQRLPIGTLEQKVHKIVFLILLKNSPYCTCSFKYVRSALRGQADNKSLLYSSCPVRKNFTFHFITH